jgi:CMP-N-acetylneuraminic acid synthetase
MKSRIIALVPMRHNSERVPGKNYRMFAGKPLFHCILVSLLKCDYVEEIVIDTDSPAIMEDVSKKFPQVKLLERPNHLRAGTVPMNDVLAWDVSQIEADFYLQTHSTNPLLRTETIKEAIEFFLRHYPHCDSLFSVTRLQTRLWDQKTRPVNHNPKILLCTQDLPPIYEENSNLYIFTKDSLENNKNRIGDNPIIFEIDRREAIDIDEELDFQIAEFLYQKSYLKKKDPEDNGIKGTYNSTLYATRN